jgi:hypothetical protein
MVMQLIVGGPVNTGTDPLRSADGGANDLGAVENVERHAEKETNQIRHSGDKTPFEPQ